MSSVVVEVSGTNLERGTMRAANYAAVFPERVGSFVLDAVVPHTLVRSPRWCKYGEG